MADSTHANFDFLIFIANLNYISRCERTSSGHQAKENKIQSDPTNHLLVVVEV